MPTDDCSQSRLSIVVRSHRSSGGGPLWFPGYYGETMILGVVDANLQVTVRLYIEDVSGQTHPIDAIIDTGFSGFLSIPSAQIASLGLPWITRDQVLLGDGTIQWFDIYFSSIIWDTQSRSVRVYAINTNPLVGMK